MSGVLGWEDTGSLGKTGKGDEEEVSPSMSKISWSAWSSAWDWMRNPRLAYGSGLKAGQGRVTLQWESVTGHLIRTSEQKRSSVGRQEKPHVPKL